jgi:hypothetical protein
MSGTFIWTRPSYHKLLDIHIIGHIEAIFIFKDLLSPAASW